MPSAPRVLVGTFQVGRARKIEGALKKRRLSLYPDGEVKVGKNDAGIIIVER